MTDSQRQSDRAGNGARAAWVDAEASRFMEQIGAERLTLAKQRFAGADPTVQGPAGKNGPRLVARILAADREGALVLTGESTVNPAEDRAEASLQRAIGAVTRWQFDVASRELGEVTGLSRSAVRQQRASLIQAMLRLVRALVWTTPGERLRPEDNAARALLRRLDVLSPDEIEHYRAEVERLTGHWRAAASDDETWRAWALLRGRIAMHGGADEAMLAWALRAWDRQPEPERNLSTGLAQLLDGARLIFAELAGQPWPENAPDPPHPRDVLLAVAGTLAAQTGDSEPFSMTNRFALVRWHEPPAASVEESPL